MAKYDYIKCRVNEEERRILESMVAAGEVASLSDGVRKLAYGRRIQSHDIMQSFLQEISGAHNALAELVRSGVASGKLTEADIVLMEREVRRLVLSAAKLSREIRRGM